MFTVDFFNFFAIFYQSVIQKPLEIIAQLRRRDFLIPRKKAQCCFEYHLSAKNVGDGGNRGKRWQQGWRRSAQ